MTTLQASVWAISVVAVVIALILLRNSRGACVVAVRVYLSLHLISSSVLYPLWTLNKPCLYLTCYTFLSAAMVVAELGILAAVFVEFRGKHRAFGMFRTWLGSAVLVGLIFTVNAFQSGPAAASAWGQAWVASDQILGYIRNILLVLIPVFAWVSGSSWNPIACKVWLGCAMYAMGDFTAQQITFMQRFHPRAIVSMLPSIAFAATLFFWVTAFRPARKHKAGKEQFHTQQQDRMLAGRSQ